MEGVMQGVVGEEAWAWASVVALPPGPTWDGAEEVCPDVATTSAAQGYRRTSRRRERRLDTGLPQHR